MSCMDSSAAPEPCTPRYERAVRVLYSGHYDHLTSAQARALIDSDRPIRNAGKPDWSTTYIDEHEDFGDHV